MMKAPTKAPCQFEVDARHQQGIADDLEQRRADDRAVGGAGAAHQVGAADHRRRDDAQLVADWPSALIAEPL